jgi:hypothetical protein
MTSDDYVASVVGKYAVSTGMGSPADKAAAAVVPRVREWAGANLLNIGFSGSYAKGTAITLGIDVDLFISLSSGSGQGVKETYWNLFRWCADRQLRPEAGNVSVRVECEGVRVDLVPGRKQKGNTRDHTLYSRRKDSWTQTNVEQHIQLVARCGRRDEIRAMKVWRERQRLDFPSFYLELCVIEPLKGKRVSGLAENVREAMRYLAEDFPKARVVDPANSNNVISDDLGAEEKGVIARAASKSLAMTSWESVLW